jgi:hypothetical protein
MPGFRDRVSRTDFFRISDQDMTTVQFSQATARSDTAMWGTGEILGPPQPPALILIGDTVPGDTSTTATLVVDAPHTIGTTETIGDQDFYKVTLVAGHDYEVGMYAKTGGPSGIPQADSYVEIYDSAGNLLASGDGGANTLHNNANSGFDVLMTFTPDVSGTYYINARAFDQDPTNGTDGDTVGDYEVFVQTASPFAYHSYYDDSSPLYSIDWGTQVDGSSRNPDGDEGPRPTGNPDTGYAYNPYGIVDKNVITYYFAKQGEVFIDEDPTTPGTTDTIVANGFADWEKAAYLQAMGAYAHVADIVYVEVPNRAQADFVFITYNGTPGPGVSLLGQMNPPDEENEGRSMFNAADERWNEADLQPGGFSFVTLVHEMGHGHGLAHPHDNGGHSGIMHGVVAEGVAFDYTNGDFDLNQGIYTVMSYEDGWQKSPYGQAQTTDPYGWQGGLMAFDIAAIQDKYGVNEDTNTGNDTYVIKDVNAPGTMYLCIWDAGGTDIITYGGSADAVIDLRPATLKYEYGGGGWVSYATGIYGGYTIANAVTIENATSGSGNDVLTGNDAVNILTGGAGNDTYYIQNAGDSVIEAGAGGNDRVVTTVSYVLSGTTAVETLEAVAGTAAINLTGNGLNQTLIGNDGANMLHGGGGNDVLQGLGGNDIYFTDVATVQIIEANGGGSDQLYTSVSFVLSSSEVELLSTNSHAATTAINLTGNSNDQTLLGNQGANVLHGGGGTDILVGYGGNDVYLTDVAATQAVEAVGGGSDQLYSSVSYTLAAGSEIELLSTNSTAATTALNMTGNEFGQTVLGNAGANTLDGKGGADTMYGYGGADTFAFTTALGSGNIDHIADFSAVDDTIALAQSAFAGLGLGALSANAFVVGTAAGDADDRIIYNSATGALFYDADGNGAGAAVQFATLDTHPTLTASDFTVI